MKLFKEDSLYLTRKQWTKLFVAFSIMILVLYTAAMICSLCGSKYFILNYQNEQMDKIETFMRSHSLMPFINSVFLTIEFVAVLSFVLKKIPKWYYILAFYVLPLIPVYIFKHLPSWYYTFHPFLFHLVIPIIEQLIDNHSGEITEKFSWKKYFDCLIRLAMAVLVVLILQAMILIIKAGYFDGVNHIQSLSAAFIYAIEYDIALSVILFTLVLLFDREKGDSKAWTTIHNHGSSSQTSMMPSQKSSIKKSLTKTQRNKIRLLYLKLYLSQLGAFLLVMVLPFLLGKVLEFLVMYVAFCIARYILGFKYSLHYKKESVCITVGIIVFGILSLAVPFFYIVLVIAISMGIGLAVLLHLSYKYKGFYLFAKMAKADRFALLYTYFDGDIEHHHVKVMCKHKGLDDFQAQIIAEFMDGNKMSYIAWKHNYSLRMMNYKIDEAIEKLIN